MPTRLTTPERSAPDESHVLHVIAPPTQNNFRGTNDEGCSVGLHVGYTGRLVIDRFPQ
jgi:hypothetical protein